MLLRIALFISLLALFYYYCQDGSSTSQRPVLEDVNMNNIQKNEVYPMFEYELIPETNSHADSTRYFVSTRGTDPEVTDQLFSAAQ